MAGGNFLGSITPSQAWAILKRHARDEVAPLRLLELCQDNDRVSSLVAVHNSECGDEERSQQYTLIVDLSRQRMTDLTLNHLLSLAASKQLKTFITMIAWGQNNPQRPVEPQRMGDAKIRPQLPMLEQAKMTYLKEFQRAAETTLKQQQEALVTASDAIPSMHLALRVPLNEEYEMFSADGKNVLPGIHQEWHRIQLFSDSLRRGQVKGGSGQMIRDVVVVGRGTCVAALKFVYQALQKDENAVIASRFGMANDFSSAGNRIRLLAGGGQQQPASAHLCGRRLLFLTSLDPNAAAALTADLDPSATLVISIALEGNEETGLITNTLKNWLLKSMGSNRRTDSILAKHMILITGSDRIASVINKPESVYLIPEHSRCEAFTSFSVATLLPLSVVFGWPLVETFLKGGHDMDIHFVETNPRHNLPVLLALTDVWNDTFLDATARVVTPFSESLTGFPAFVGALEAQTCGRSMTGVGNDRPSCSSMILDGGLDGSLDRALYQSGKIVNSELVIGIDSQINFNTARTIGAHGMEGVQVSQDALMCSFFAHADELAFGSKWHPSSGEHSFSPASASSHHTKPSELSRGNRPSVLLMCGRLDAFTCGQLIALSEHRAAVKAHLWGIDPFVRDGGPSLRLDRTDDLKTELQKLFAADGDVDEEDGADDQHLYFSTKTLLSHYASTMRNQRY